MTTSPAGQLHMQVMWNRLISVVEEQAQALLRTAFGSVVREAGDLSAGVYDLRGRMLAQAVTGTPGHVNTMAVAVGHFLERFPIDAMREGDVFVTNDPWMGTGHLFDFVVVTPAFRAGRLVSLFASTCHLVDVGGLGFSADARSVYEEGIRVPHMKLYDQGTLNDVLMRVIETNVRQPIEAKGDMMALVSCNNAGCKRFVAMMDEFGIASIEPLAEHILENSRRAMEEAVRKVPQGDYRASMTLDGYEDEVRLELRMTVKDGAITLDYEGSSAASKFGINSPKCYSDAYSVFGLKCVVAPEVPNNAGSLSVIRVEAPEGSIVNPLHPSPVTARHVVGQMLPDIVFGCLHQAMSGGVQAESSGSIWVLAMSGPTERDSAEAFTVMSVSVGGVGARPTKDGLDSTAFPSGVGAIPVEVTESVAPVVFWRREFQPDSGGAGRFRGGLGQTVEIESRKNLPFQISAATFDRLKNPARGREKGEPGAAGQLKLAHEHDLVGKGVHEVPPGKRLVIELPGGGGFGDPRTRSPDTVTADVRNGIVSREAARKAYGVAVRKDGSLDEAETAKLRRG